MPSEQLTLTLALTRVQRWRAPFVEGARSTDPLEPLEPVSLDELGLDSKAEVVDVSVGKGFICLTARELTEGNGGEYSHKHVLEYQVIRQANWVKKLEEGSEIYCKGLVTSTMEYKTRRMIYEGLLQLLRGGPMILRWLTPDGESMDVECGGLLELDRMSLSATRPSREEAALHVSFMAGNQTLQLAGVNYRANTFRVQMFQFSCRSFSVQMGYDTVVVLAVGNEDDCRSLIPARFYRKVARERWEWTCFSCISSDGGNETALEKLARGTLVSHNGKDCVIIDATNSPFKIDFVKPDAKEDSVNMFAVHPEEGDQAGSFDITVFHELWKDSCKVIEIDEFEEALSGACYDEQRYKETYQYSKENGGILRRVKPICQVELKRGCNTLALTHTIDMEKDSIRWSKQKVVYKLPYTSFDMEHSPEATFQDLQDNQHKVFACAKKCLKRHFGENAGGLVNVDKLLNDRHTVVEPVRGFFEVTTSEHNGIETVYLMFKIPMDIGEDWLSRMSFLSLGCDSDLQILKPRKMHHWMWLKLPSGGKSLVSMRPHPEHKSGQHSSPENGSVDRRPQGSPSPYTPTVMMRRSTLGALVPSSRDRTVASPTRSDQLNLRRPSRNDAGMSSFGGVHRPATSRNITAEELVSEVPLTLYDDWNNRI